MATAQKVSDLKPILDRIIIRKVEAQKTTEGGILLTDKSKTNHFEGEVLAVGPGWYDQKGKFHEMVIKVGDKIFHEKNTGHVINYANEDFLVLRQSDVLTVRK